MKILFVDDEPEILEQAKIFLEKADKRLKVKVAQSGEKALDLLKKDSFDAVISDYKMPGMDGLDLLRKIKKKGFDTIFCILTGKGDEKTSYKALNLGANGYFTKFTNPEKGFGKLANLLVKSIEKRQTRNNHLIAWITLRKGWGVEKDEEFKQALKELGEIIGFEISEIETREVSPEKEIIKAYTDNYSTISKSKENIAKKWKEIITKEPEVVDAGFKSKKKHQKEKPQAK